MNSRIVLSIAGGVLVAVAGVIVGQHARLAPQPTAHPTDVVVVDANDETQDASADGETTATGHDGTQNALVENDLASFYAEPVIEAFAGRMRRQVEASSNAVAHETNMLVETVECRSSTCIARMSTTRDDLPVDAVRTAVDHAPVAGCRIELLPSMLPDAGISSLDLLYHCGADGLRQP